MSHETSANRCPACGAEIPEGAPQALCPKCLLAGVGTTQKLDEAPSHAHAPPQLEEVAAAFPNLEILELIGQGGMGCVFKARQPRLDRLVALKLLPARFAADASFRERFSREARVLARLNHPNIVSVFDFGEAGGFFYLLMEFVDGANLRQAMQAGRFTPEQALAIVPKICEALQFAHGEGILHRDIKPENILLDTRGRVKIADFGIAKLVGETMPNTRLTATGAAVGTPQYMAPEQLERPQEVDHRADIFSLGVVFYEMLTGELPLGRFAPPSTKTPMDPRVDEVVLRTLEKEREKRYQSAEEVRTRVEHITKQCSAADESAVPASPTDANLSPGIARWSRASIVGALLVGLSLPVSIFMGIALLIGAEAARVLGIVIVLAIVCLLGGPGTLLGWIGLSDIRAHKGRLRGLPLAVFAALTWPLGSLLVTVFGATWLIPVDAFNLQSLEGWAGFLVWLVPAGLLTFAIWAVYAASRWGSNQPKDERRGVLKWIFVALLLALVGGAVARRPRGTPSGPEHPANAITLQASVPPRETFVVKGIVLSNGVPVSGRELRSQLWPPSSTKRCPYAIQWQRLEGDILGRPWEIVVSDRTSDTIAARLRPLGVPRLEWELTPKARELHTIKVSRQARAFEVARALQTFDDGNAGTADWSVRIELQSSPVPPGTAQRGIKAEFRMPAHQVAVFEMVTGSQRTVVPVPGFAAYQVNGSDETFDGSFQITEDLLDLDSQTGLPRWRYGITAPDGRLTQEGQATPAVPEDFRGSVEVWHELKPDAEVIWGLPEEASSRPFYGLRIRTQSIRTKPGLRYVASGFGTNWMPEAASHLVNEEP